jgi:ribosomal protein RSM22 (predicted rRNA methylase)
MQLPPPLRQAVERELSAHPLAELRVASERLSQNYREPRSSSRPMVNSADRAAYLGVRLPATYAAVFHALGWAAQGTNFAPHSALDLGSGPGTALWAACELFPSLASVAAVERDSALVDVAQRMAASAPYPALREAQWQVADLTSPLPAEPCDLVLCSYALNELTPAQRTELVTRAWARCKGLLLIVEPGTVAGFANILSARTQLLRDGARIVAPCPNQQPCPMASNDWCHFAARVERTAEHRRLKQAELGHEDEKFSYMAVAREGFFAENSDAAPNSARILRHPRIFSGYAQLTLCTEGKVEQTTVTRSHKDEWRRLKRLGWGDRW